MQDTRRQILEILKRHGEVTVQDLSSELGLTSVTVRHHLEILRSEGYITEPEVRRSNRPGRPRYVYRLTSTAADLFPNNYSGLATALLDTLEEALPPEQREDLLAATAQRMAEEVGELPADPAQRVESVTAFLKKQGFVIRWEQDQEGRFLIHISNCPYHYVAQKHGETCAIDEMMLSHLFDGTLTRVEGHAHKGGVCTYAIELSED